MVDNMAEQANAAHVRAMRLLEEAVKVGIHDGMGWDGNFSSFSMSVLDLAVQGRIAMEHFLAVFGSWSLIFLEEVLKSREGDNSAIQGFQSLLLQSLNN